MMSNEDAILHSEALVRRLERVNNFGSKYQVSPTHELERIAEEMYGVAQSLPVIETPMAMGAVISAELKRRLYGEARNLEHSNNGHSYDFDAVLDAFEIPRTDVDDLGGWLLQHRSEVTASIERLFDSSDLDSSRLPVQLDVPHIRRQVEEVAQDHVRNYHKKLGNMLQARTGVGSFLRDIDAVATHDARSYFSPAMNMLAIGIPAICYSERDGSLRLKERELIQLYGHEGMGHALNAVLTQLSGLPYLFKQSSTSVSGTAESVAQHFEQQIFEDLKESTKTQEALGIKHLFPEIYQDAHDLRELDAYKQKLFYYAITVLADKTFGDPRDPATIARRIDAIQPLAIYPGYARNIVHNNVTNYDPEGNLSPGLVSELRYCAQPVKHALERFEAANMPYAEHRSLIDGVLLTGFWTPRGLLDAADVAIREHTTK
jgi:hypothetical protein